MLVVPRMTHAAAADFNLGQKRGRMHNAIERTDWQNSISSTLFSSKDWSVRVLPLHNFKNHLTPTSHLHYPAMAMIFPSPYFRQLIILPRSRVNPPILFSSNLPSNIFDQPLSDDPAGLRLSNSSRMIRRNDTITTTGSWLPKFIVGGMMMVVVERRTLKLRAFRRWVFIWRGCYDWSFY
ncbi:hypothetical protein PM082_009264 [Marasmius tenuissimus]|nr:hypothetical protein PM082_009264 [Marasmius tenuissimus]